MRRHQLKQQLVAAAERQQLLQGVKADPVVPPQSHPPQEPQQRATRRSRLLLAKLQHMAQPRGPAAAADQQGMQP